MARYKNEINSLKRNLVCSRTLERREREGVRNNGGRDREIQGSLSFKILL